MSIQRLICAVRSSPLWQGGKSLKEACAERPGLVDGVDLAWYLRKYRKLTRGVPSFSECIEHYSTNAAALSLSPNLAFDEVWYRHSYPDADAAVRSGSIRCGWEHYLQEGAARQYNPTLWFDEQWYQRHHHEPWYAVKSGALTCGFEHYLLYGIHQDLQPSLYFDPAWYRRCYLGSNGNSLRAVPVVDYAMSEDKGARCPAPFFDETWYCARYLTGGSGGSSNGHPNGTSNSPHAGAMSGFEHYMFRGRLYGFSPSPRFNEMAYREMNPEMARLIEQGRYTSGFEHYVEEGARAGNSVPTHYELGGVDYAGPDFLRSYERSLRLNFLQFRRLKELVERAQ